MTEYAIKGFRRTKAGNLVGSSWKTAGKLYKHGRKWSPIKSPQICQSGWHVYEWSAYSIRENRMHANCFYLVECRGDADQGQAKVCWSQIRLVKKLFDNVDFDKVDWFEFAQKLLEVATKEKEKRQMKDMRKRVKELRQ